METSGHRWPPSGRPFPGGRSCPPRHIETARGGAPHWRLWVIVASVILLAGLGGCASTASRFRTLPHEPASAANDDDELRYAPRIKEEELREDDRKVDVQELSKKYSQRRKPAGNYSNGTPAGLNRDRLLLDVVSFLGAPYLYGGTSREGIDCSGLTSRVYESAVKKLLPRSAREQYQVGKEVSKDELAFGDLVFFSTTGRTPSHVGIYIEDDIFVHASVLNGVTISSLESTYYRTRFVGGRRVVGD